MSLARVLIPILCMIVGLSAMVVAWVVLLSGSTNPVIILLEFGGVAVFLAGYFFRKREKKARADASSTASEGSLALHRN